MATKKRALGKGLEALLGGSPDLNALEQPLQSAPAKTPESAEMPAAATETADGESLRDISVDLITRCAFQPRRHFDEAALRELADSIVSQGLIQPIVVRPKGDGFELVAGERRWRAMQLAKRHTIKAIVRDLDDKAAAAHALIENIQRKDLNPIEEASALNRLLDEFTMTHAQVAESVGRSRASVTNLLRLLELRTEVKELLEQGGLSMGHARALIPLEGSEQLVVAQQVLRDDLSVRATEALVKQRLKGEDSRPKSDAIEDPNIRELADNLSQRLGAKVSIKQGQKGKGQVVIAYDSLIQLDGILGHIN
ncbi:MAG: ParB/RepB/Spo0J family partition protein [Granulosicoccaceae bacterium]